jgi:hypothetical protein
MNAHGLQLRAKHSEHGLTEGAVYDVVERDGSFVTVRDFDGNVFGRGQEGGLKGRPTLAVDRFEVVFHRQEVAA